VTQPAASSSSAVPVALDIAAAEIVILYSQAEQQLLANLARIADQHDPSMMLLLMRREAQRVTAILRARSLTIVTDAITEAGTLGMQHADTELRRVPAAHRVPLLRSLPLPKPDPVPAIADLMSKLNATIPQILRFADDAYRAATLTALDVIADNGTQALAQQAAWRQLTERGITGFVDSRGRKWNLASYVEMASRTAVNRTYRAANLARMVDAGFTTFTVPGDGHPCPQCRPWEHRVLTLDGPSPTIAEAEAAGLWHPNCRHSLSVFQAGHTRLPAPAEWTPADQARYDAVQQLRALERQVRAYKRAAAGARTQLDAKRAQARVRATQALIRAHVERHDLVRRTRREQLNLGNR
jgi:hypothetical protein